MIRVLIHGLAYFSRQFPELLESDGWAIRHFGTEGSANLAAMTGYLHRCDLAYTWGGRLTMGRFLSAARLLRKKKVVMFWCGSDTLDARQDYEAGRADSWIANKIHWAGAPWLAEEVRAIGISCEYVPSTWVKVPDEIPALPVKFSVLAYLPDAERVHLYGIDHVLEVARKMPEIKFNVVGLQPGQKLSAPSNVTVHGWTADMRPFYQKSTVVWRPVRHDGLSFMALEAMGHARHVMWSYPFPGSTVANDAPSGYAEIQRLVDLHLRGKLLPNWEASTLIANQFSPEKIRLGILSRWKRIVESTGEPAGAESLATVSQETVAPSAH